MIDLKNLNNAVETISEYVTAASNMNTAAPILMEIFTKVEESTSAFGSYGSRIKNTTIEVVELTALVEDLVKKLQTAEKSLANLDAYKVFKTLEALNGIKRLLHENPQLINLVTGCSLEKE